MQKRPEWQTAQALLLVVECDGDTLLAYIGIMRVERRQAVRAGRSAQARRETPHHSVNGDIGMERGPAAVHPRDGAEAFRRGRSHFGS